MELRSPTILNNAPKGLQKKRPDPTLIGSWRKFMFMATTTVVAKLADPLVRAPSDTNPLMRALYTWPTVFDERTVG